LLLNVKGIPGCVVRKNGVSDADIGVVHRNTSANPAGVIVGNRAIDDRRWRIVKQDGAADIGIAIRSSSSNLVARKSAVDNRGRCIYDPDAATLTWSFIASKCGIREGKSPVGFIGHYHQTAANSAAAAGKRQNFVVFEGAICNIYAVLRAGEQVSCSAFAPAFVVFKYAFGNANYAGSLARRTGSVCVNCAAETP
jgi:hypothetical protein